MGLHYNSMAEGAHHTVMLVNGTFVGFTIILVGLFAGEFEELSLKIEI